MDYGHEQTEEKLKKLEKRIATVFGDALKELKEESKEFFDWFQKEDEKKKLQLENEEITEEQYKKWRLEQIRKSSRYKTLEKKLAQRVTEANKIAVAYINNDMAAIFALNHNFSAFELEQMAGDLSFTLWNEDTVRLLVEENPDILPDLSIDEEKDIDWNRKQVNKAILSGILQGKSVDKIADDLVNRLKDINQNAAIRNARTATTAAENAGRQESYKRAAEMGIQFRKRWVATLDGRTRDSHRDLDGQTVDWDKPFKSKLGKIRYPGDKSAKPADVWGCRCTMRTVEKEGIEAEPRQRRARDPKTGKNVLIADMTYKEWERRKDGSRTD